MKTVKQFSKKINDKISKGYGINNFNNDARLFIDSLKKGVLCFSSQSKGKTYVNDILMHMHLPARQQSIS